jgi:hypothetical protein
MIGLELVPPPKMGKIARVLVKTGVPVHCGPSTVLR